MGTGNGVDLQGSGATVRNGTVRGMGQLGVRLGTNALAEDLCAVSNGNGGIVVT